MNGNQEYDIAATARMVQSEARRDRSRRSASAEPVPKRRSPLLLWCSVIALAATSALNLLGANPLAVEIPEQTPQQEEQSQHEALAMQRDWVEGYRAETGHLPDEESEAWGPWSFVNLDGEEFKVGFKAGDHVLLYSSTDAEHRLVEMQGDAFK
jgi:hypothetical protein